MQKLIGFRSKYSSDHPIFISSWNFEMLFLFILEIYILEREKIVLIEIIHAMTYKKPHNYFSENKIISSQKLVLH